MDLFSLIIAANRGMKKIILCIVLLPLSLMAQISFSQMVCTFESESNGLIRLDPQALLKPVNRPLSNESILLNQRPLLMNEITFKKNQYSNAYYPSQLIKPEQIQSIFKFDKELFIKQNQAQDFLDAKWNHYRNLKYDLNIKSFVHQVPLLTDWTSLNHPPIAKIQNDMSIYSKSLTQEIPQNRYLKSAQFQTEMDQISDSELSSHNQVIYLNDDEVTQSRIKIAQSARRTLWGSSLLMTCDSGTKPLIDILEQKVKDGVDVRIMLDNFMQSVQNGNCEKELQSKGIKILLVKGMISHWSAFHMKMWIADLDQAQIEGMNIINAQTLATGLNHLYHDSGLFFKGPLVTDAYDKYIYLWNSYSKEKMEPNYQQIVMEQKNKERLQKLRGSAVYSDPNQEESGESCRLVTQDRKSVIDRLGGVFLKYINSAERQIITTSVRVSSKDLKGTEKIKNLNFSNLIHKSIKDHIQVEFLFNSDKNVFSPYYTPSSGIGDQNSMNFVTGLMVKQRNLETKKTVNAELDFFENLNRHSPQFRAWSYMDFSHLKVTLIDQETLIAGSYNPYTKRSGRDAEIIVICQSKKLGQQASRYLIKDLANSVPVPFKSQTIDSKNEVSHD